LRESYQNSFIRKCHSFTRKIHTFASKETQIVADSKSKKTNDRKERKKVKGETKDDVQDIVKIEFVKEYELNDEDENTRDKSYTNTYFRDDSSGRNSPNQTMTHQSPSTRVKKMTAPDGDEQSSNQLSLADPDIPSIFGQGLLPLT
jgi:hypothetical protein